MGSMHHLHLTTSFGRSGITVDDVAAEIRIREEDGPMREYGVLHFQFGTDRFSIFVDHAEANAIAAKLASDFVAQLPVIGTEAVA